MTWTRSPGIPPHTSRALVFADPTFILCWSSWDGDWSALTAAGVSDVAADDLAAWCERVGVEMPTGADLDWARGEGQ